MIAHEMAITTLKTSYFRGLRGPASQCLPRRSDNADGRKREAVLRFSRVAGTSSEVARPPGTARSGELKGGSRTGGILSLSAGERKS
jgi:hypothetical protein